MPFTVLSDANVKSLLASLTASELGSLLDVLSDALYRYSNHGEGQYQPHRSSVHRDGQVSLFMPATSNSSIAVKMVGLPGPDAKPAPEGVAQPGLKSVMTICDSTGQAIGVLNAAEFTAFRTSLGSMLLYQYRKTSETIVVFGAGKQALWHTRLALLLPGKDIRKITIVNRSVERARQVLNTLAQDDQSKWNSKPVCSIFDESQGSLEDLLADADVIFCTTPSTEPLFPAEFHTSERSRKKTRFVSAIGSYRLDMQEIPPKYLNAVVDSLGTYNIIGKSGGVIAVDSRDACFKEAGELVKANVESDNTLEIGEIERLKKDLGDKERLLGWLEKGDVVYKSVGTGVMDISLGRSILDLAVEKKSGWTAEEF